MALNDFAVVRPNSKNGGVDPLELAIDEFTGVVEGTIARKSVLKGMIPVKPVKGTATLSNYAVGESTLQKLGNDGTTLDGTSNDFSKITVTVDTVVAARATLPLLDVFQTNFDARKEIGVEHGKKIAKFYDQSFFIQAIKAAKLASSPYGSDGHYGGSTKTLSASGDKSDPAKLYSAIADLFTTMEGKDVEPGTDDIMLAFKPEQFYTLLQAEQIVNGEYVTADGTSIKGMIFKAFGCPAIRSNNLPAESTISGHLLSNSGNSNAYDSDFTKVLAVAFSPRALLAGETIPLQTKVFFDDVSKLWFVDAWLSYAVTPNRPEYAGAILLP
jgi:hypothetical protein